MNERDWLAQRFEANRAHLHAIAYRMLGSLSEADDAVQEAWLRLGRADASAIDDLGGWLRVSAATPRLIRWSRRRPVSTSGRARPPSSGC